MQKKSIIAILSAVVLMVVASLALVFTVGPMASADSEEIPVVPVDCLNITNGVLGDGTNSGAFNANGKTWIQNHAKYRVEIPANITVTSIGSYAFDCCSGLTSITIPEGVTSIGARAFKNCSGLTSVTFAENSQLTSIGNYAFCWCRGLTSITIPESVTSIGSYAFSACSGLTSITVDPNNTKYTSQDNEGHECNCIIEKSSNTLLYGCQNTVIPEGVTSIRDYALRGFSGLTSITIPEGVTSIGNYAFEGCSGLTSITIPEGVISIGSYAFRDCSGLTEIIVRNPDLMTNTELQSYASKLHYGAEQNTVTFNTMGGTEVPDQVIDFGEFASEPTAEKAGHCFSGWYLDEQYTQPFTFNTPVKYDITIYAKWEINQYTVTFDSNSGSAVASQTVDYGTVINSPVTTRTGYTFKGWLNNGVAYDFSNPITEDMNLIAKWEINHYTITFDSNNGSVVASQTVDYNNKVSRPEAPTRTGYTFKKWLLNNSEYNFNTPVTGNINLTADWIVNKYTVTLNSNNGSAVSNQTVDYNTVISSPVTTRTGYTFKGWLKDGVAYDFNNPITEDMNLIADWDINVYTVTFDACNGDALVEQPVNYNEKAIRPTDPTRASANFKGWYRDLQDAESFDFNTLITENITLFAKWENVYIVSFNVNGGSAVSAQEVENGQTITRPTDPTKEHYTFAGWYTNATLTDEFDFSTPITGSMTLYAKWNINQYTVEFWWQNGTHTGSQTVDYGTPVQRPTDPTKEGYTFVGWFTDDLYQHPYDFNTPVTEDFGLFAQWTINQYTVTFDSKQGSSVLPQTVNWNTKISRPSDPVREGYDFLGWYLNNEEYNFDEFVTDNMTLTAKWKSNNPDFPDDPADPTEENPTVNNQNNNGLLWGILGTSGGILLVGGIVFGIVISKRRRK